jgi:CheY-like chemotaxis protein
MCRAPDPPAELLLIEDAQEDVRLTQKAFELAGLNIKLKVIEDGRKAMSYLRKEKGFEDSVIPSLILLDLNMPDLDGRELLTQIKGDEVLRAIPVIVFSSSESESEVLSCYQLHANCYIFKPMQLDRLIEIVTVITKFWINVVKLPATA